jgi:hypothetical protein
MDEDKHTGDLLTKAFFFENTHWGKKIHLGTISLKTPKKHERTLGFLVFG